MKKISILSFKTKNLNHCICLFLVCVLVGTILPINNMCYTYAKNQNIQYEYDSSGRLTAVRYPDGTEIRYQYDANGNIISGETKPGQTLPDKEDGIKPGQTGGEQAGNGQIGEGQAGNEQAGEEQTGDEQTGGGQAGNEQAGEEQTEEEQIGEEQTGNNQMNESQTQNASTETLHDSAEDIKNYNRFKKSKPVIKSLKQSVKKKKYYLNIRIKQINKKGIYGESGYQIKYAKNKKFKKAKTIKIARNKKSSITSKKWKVKKGTTYYVKVRAYMRTKTGKTIYSKYSKVKKITVKK